VTHTRWLGLVALVAGICALPAAIAPSPARSFDRKLVPTFTNGASPAWSPDGRRIAYISTATDPNPDGPVDKLFVMSALDGSHKQLLASVGAYDLNEVRWTSNRQVVFDALPIGRPGGVLDRLDTTTRKVSPVGQVEELPGDGISFALSPDRSQVALTTRCDGSCTPHVPVMIGVVGASGGAVRRLPLPAGDVDQEPSFSPDGKQLVFARGPRSESTGAGTGGCEIFIEPAAGGDARDLGVQGWSPQFSPDGRWIAFITSGEIAPGSYNIIVAIIPVDGGKPVGLARADVFTWSPTSDRIAYATSNVQRGGSTVGIVDVDGNRRPLPLAGIPNINHSPQWSPDGSQIAFTGVPATGRGLRNGVYVIGADGKGFRRLA
jgi:Tol biopolymer transport system component